MFWNKKKDDMDEIKEVIQPKQPTIPIQEDIPELKRIDVQPVTEPKQFAPLFVKIDKYKEVLQKIQKMKAILNNLNALAKLEEEIQKIEASIESSEQRNLEEFASTITQLDQELVRPQSFEPFIKDNRTSMDGHIKDLETEINRLKEKTQDI